MQKDQPSAKFGSGFSDYLKTQFMVVILSEAKDLKSFSAKEILRFAQDDR